MIRSPRLVGLLLALAWFGGCPTKEPVDDDITADDDDDDTTDDPDTLQVPTSLPTAGIHELYEETLIPPDFHMPPLTWSHTGGALPEGLTLQENGDVEGVATELGSFSFDVSVVDADGRSGEGTVDLPVDVNEDRLFIGIWIEEHQPICVNLDLLCAPFVRIEGAGEEQYARTLAPALFHTGPDAQPDAGLDDDMLWELLDGEGMDWDWVPLEDDTGDGSVLYPDDASIAPSGILTGGELTGRGRIEMTHPDHGEGSAIGFVVPPDWCPGIGC